MYLYYNLSDPCEQFLFVLLMKKRKIFRTFDDTFYQESQSWLANMGTER